jgi:hypothetical protein
MKKLCWLGLVILLVGGSLAWAEEKIIDPKSLDGKTLEEIYLMRNEIYARHGKPFMTHELHPYFKSQDWYKLDVKYSDSRLSKTNWKNIAILKAKEEELLKQNYLTKDGQQRINLKNIINARQFGTFSSEELEKLSANGFLVVPAKYEQLFHVYDLNHYYGIANFVTTDSVLQLYHLFFDYTLRSLEQEKLLPLLETLTKEMFKHSKILYETAKNPQIKEAARRNMAFFAVPQYFLTGNLPKMEPALAMLVKEEIDKCQKHAVRQNSLIFNPHNDPNISHAFEYTQFVPRGHYTRNKELERYFLAIVWYGLNPFSEKYEMDLLQSLIISQQLYRNKKDGKSLISLWERVYEPTVFYVGFSNNLIPQDYKLVMDTVFGEDSNYHKDNTFNYLTDKRKLEQIKKMAIESYRKKKRIEIEMEGMPPLPQFSFMGQRYVPDSDLMQRLIKFPARRFPKGLDVMAVFGTPEAKKILLEEYKEGELWNEYPERLEKLIKEFGELKPEDWQQNLYYNWLWSLKSLIELSQEFKYPFFMQNQAWQRKSINSALASWAELRHDTIAYSIQPTAQCGEGGDEWVPDPPKSYVEPNIVFYHRLGQLLIFTKKGLKQRDLLEPYMGKKFDRFLELVSFLEKAAAKEIKGELLTNKEYDKITYIGGWLEDLTLTTLDAYKWYLVGETDRNIAVIADVATSLDEVVEVGVGPAFEIYVITEIGGQLKMTRGAVFSYYEFIHPASDRLTDEKWQKIIKDKKEPSLPPWIKLFLSDKAGHEVPQPKYSYPGDPCR